MRSSLLCLSVAVLSCTASGGPPTYYADVKPILEARCVGCHTQGGIGPFPLETAEQAVQWKGTLKAMVVAKAMPPWPPAETCTTYLHGRALTEKEIDTLSRWVDTGAAVGSPADAKSAETQGAALSRVDATLTMPVQYAPPLMSSPDYNTDQYRCFLIDWPAATFEGREVAYVTGFGVRPGNARIVHHAIAFLATADKVADFEALDAAEEGPGYTCFGGPGGDTRTPWLGSWAPGGTGDDYPAGTGLRVGVGSKVVLQVHYNLNNILPDETPTPDQTSVELKLDSTVEHEAHILTFANPKWVRERSMNIPANERDVSHVFSRDPTLGLNVIFPDSTLQNGQPFTLYSAGLHMHTRGTRASVVIQRQDGSTDCMLDIPHWDFHWQGTYRFATPKVFEPGDQLSLECHWDNSAANQPYAQGEQLPVQDVNWGEKTTDEMCLGILYFSQ